MLLLRRSALSGALVLIVHNFRINHIVLLAARPSRSGLTGFWQVMGRQTTTYEERVHMDMFYVERWSIWLDLVIIAKTFWKVLKAEGAY